MKILLPQKAIISFQIYCYGGRGKELGLSIADQTELGVLRANFVL
jgi:hypothetical protein